MSSSFILNGEEESGSQTEEEEIFIQNVQPHTQFRISCPPSPIKSIKVDPSLNPKKHLSSLFLINSCRQVGKGYELSLKGERVFKNMGRRIKDRDLSYIFSHVAGEEDITSLNLANNLITSDGFVMICEYLLHSNLVSLNLRNNEIESLTVKACEILQRLTCLKRLTLSGNHLSQKSADNLQIVLKYNKSLEILELESVDFYVHCIHRLVDILMETNRTLKVLNISRILGIPRYRLRSYYLSEMLYRLLVRNDCLVELHLEKNGITDHDVEKITQALKITKTLILLNLSANYISNIGVEYVADILPDSSLQVLLLRSNTIGNHGAIALSKTMPLSKILHLDLAFNRIDDIGLANLLWTIKKPTPLYTFYIFGNRFTEKTLEIIHVQLQRGKMIPESLDIKLYWNEKGLIKFSYNPDADEYRKQLAGLYDGAHVSKRLTTLPYPIIDVFRNINLLTLPVGYPTGPDPKLLSNYKDNKILEQYLQRDRDRP